MFAQGKNISETIDFKQYVGFGNCKILALNPTKEELEKIVNTTLKKDIEYLSEREVNGVSYKTSRIVFYVKPVNEEIPIMNISFILQDRYIFNKERTKVQVIDKFGRTAWVTIEESKEHKIPLDKNGNKLRIDEDYRPCYVGEENLTNFIKTYMGVPDITYFDREKQCFVEREDTSICLARLDTMDEIIKGNVKEIRDIISLQQNVIKIMFGVRIDDQGLIRQTFYPEAFLPGNASKQSQSKFFTRLCDRKAQSSTYAKYSFSENEIHEYVLNPQEVLDNPNIPANQESKTDDLPF